MGESQPGLQKQPIAIIGLGCRFPGGCDSPASFWDLMAGGADGIVPVPAERWNREKFFDADEQMPSRMYIQAGGFLRSRIDQFDSQFFGLSPREAALLDPQQRLLLEVAWEAMEDAGLVVEKLAGSSTGVYIGGLALDNMMTQLHPDNLHTVGVHTAVSTMMTMLSNRLSYTFDLRGPSMSIDTACSSSLVAVHQACQAIWNGECQQALVGGVNVMHRPEYLVVLCKGGFLARDGRCKSFDDRADGYGRGEGAGIAVLKPYADALRDGDRIYAVIRGTGVNQDGRTDGITVPNPDAQETLVRRVMAEAGVTARDLSYVEAHGTGTAVGDPLETSALAAAIGRERDDGQPIPIGSVKANIGHLEAAAGIAGFIKSALVLSHRQIPPLAQLGTPNTRIPFKDWNLRLPTQLEAMQGQPGELFVGINSFGYGGTNAHVVLQDLPDVSAPQEAQAAAEARPNVLPISARSAAALQSLAGSYADLLEQADPATFNDLCRSAARRRDHHDHRVAVVGDSAEAMRQQLLDFRDKGELVGGFNGTSSHKHQRPVFVFTGMGPQWWAMGRELYAHEPIFKAALDDCNAVFQRTANWDVLAELLAPEELSKISVPHLAACTNFLLQVGLVTLWRSWGIEPAAVVGHSLGEVGAAWGSGALDLESAIDVLYHRSRLLNQIAGQGTMASVNMSAEAVAPYLAAEAGRVSIAAINSPKSVTLTGDTESLKRIAAKLEQIKVSPIFMQVQMAYHSAYMEPLKEELYASLKHVKVQSPHCEVYSSVTGTHVQPNEMNIDYWWHNMREPVYFANAIDALIEDGHRVFLEVGPQPVLSSSIKHCLAHRNVTGHLIASLRRTRPERVCLREMVALLYAVGMPIRWEGVYPEAGAYLRLPTYPWQRETCWHETDKGREGRLGSPAHPLLGERVNASQPVWESRMVNGLLPYLVDHHVQGLRVLAGACYAEQGLALHASLGQGGPNVIENMQFDKAFVIEPHDEPVMHVGYDEALRQYEVRSRTRQGSEWRLHARGELSFLKPVQPAPVALAPLQARCTVPMTGDEHYRDMTGRGLEYGPYFRGVQQLWRDESGDEVLAKVEGREALADRPGAYRLHPALLDAVLQTLLTTLGSKGDNEVYIPVQIRRLVLHASPTGAFWCNARLLSRWEGGAEGEVVIFDEAGQVIAEVQGVRAQALTRQDQASDRPFEQWLYEFQWQAADAVVPKAGGRWVVLEDKQGLGIRLARELRQAGVDEVMQLPASMDFDRRLELLAAQVAAGVRGVVYLGGLDAGSDDFGTPAGIQMIRLIQLLSTQAAVPEFVVVTREAQRVHPDEIQPNVAQATLIGGVRVANNEYPGFSLKAIDIDGQPSSLVALAREILSEGIEDEIALRGKERHVHRLRRSRVQDLVSPDDAVGRTSEAARDPGEHEVRVALRRIRVDAGPLHVAVGEVEQAGRSVDQVQIGTQVLAYVSSLTATAVTLPAGQVFPIPEGDADPADLALFAQAACALSHLDRQIGAQVVVTGAASGLGHVVIDLARRQGMTVFALVEGAAQARVLSGIADARVIDASAGDAFEEIRRQTEGRGVDLVIDVLSGELSQKAATLLAPFGRFVSLSGQTIVGTSAWLRGNRSVHRIDMPGLIEHQPEMMGRFWREAAAGFEEGVLSAPPRRSVPQPKPHELQTDPIVLPDTGVLDLSIAARSRGKSLFEADASYLITGGFGGFGLEIAAWMVGQGARHLVLVGRRGANTVEAERAVQALEKAGARVMCAAADVSLQADVIRLIDEVRRDMPVLRGVFHTAAVLQDSPINQILPEHVHAVMNPKAAGGWYLHQHTQDLPLDHFVLFSSVAGLVGGPGQASYAMSCEYQDALARHRRALGMPAISINWGALAEVGMIARHGEVAKYFSVTGVGSFSPAQAVDMLGKALAWNPVHIGMAIMDWRAWGGTYPAWAASPKYVELVGETDPSEGAQGDSALLTSLRALPEEERRQNVEDLLCSLLAQVSQMPTARIDRQASLINLGLDSLMAMELQMAIETNVAVKVSTLELMKGNNLVQLSQLVSSAIVDKGAPGQAAPAAVSEAAAQAVPSVADQVKALLDDEVDELLLQLLADEQVKEQA